MRHLTEYTSLSVLPEQVNQSLQWTWKTPKINTLADRLIKRNWSAWLKNIKKEDGEWWRKKCRAQNKNHAKTWVGILRVFKGQVLSKRKFFLHLKVLQNYILSITQMWSLFCSLKQFCSLNYFVKLGFCLSVFWFSMFFNCIFSFHFLVFLFYVLNSMTSQ